MVDILNGVCEKVISEWSLSKWQIQGMEFVKMVDKVNGVCVNGR